MTLRILAVDDDAPIGRALVRMLRPCHVVVVSSAEAALRALAEGTFDALLTDYGIAPTDGLTLLREVAATYPGVRRYLMSGFDPGRFDTEVASGLIMQVFPKPLEIPVLRAVLQGPG
jgi:DNA-binding NtrC family response regulator